jgi:2-dehydro-3-deoxyglucarate aldolase
MNKINQIKKIRKKLKNNSPSIGSWMQINDPSVAEIMGDAGFDWIAVDMEHGSISTNDLPCLFRSLELGNTLPIVRLGSTDSEEIKRALDAGACGVIFPKIESALQIETAISNSKWPPSGSRGVAFSRANLFGKRFAEYKMEAQAPLIIVMIETKEGIKNINQILKVQGIDAVLVGPYDLSASLGVLGDFNDKHFIESLLKIQKSAIENHVSMGIHIVEPSRKNLNMHLKQGYRFIAYSIDAVFLRTSLELINGSYD